jgi:hypothetical protein
MDKITITPYFSGERFKNHTLPLDVVGELVVLQDIILEISRWLFKQDNPDKPQVPKGFKQQAKLSIAKIKKGSSGTQLVQDRLSGQLNLDSTVDRAASMTLDILEMFGGVTPITLPADFPSTILSRFDNLATSLHENEFVYFKRQERRVVMNRAICSRVASHAPQMSRQLRRIRGKVVAMDLEAGTFHLRCGETKILGKFTDAFYTRLLGAFATKYRPMLELECQVLLSAQGKIEKIESMKGFAIINTDHIRARLERLLEIDPQWLSAYGELRVSLVKDFVRIWEDLAPQRLESPAIYPAGEETVELEWLRGRQHTIVELSPKTMLGEVIWYEEDGLRVDETPIDLSDHEGWVELDRLVSEGPAND